MHVLDNYRKNPHMAEAKWSADGQMFSELIDAKGFERREFASLLGVSEDVLSNLVRGVTRLRGDRRKKAAALLGITESELRPKPGTVVVPARLGRPPLDPPITRAVPVVSVNIKGEVFVARAGQRIVPVYGSLPAGPPQSSYNDAISCEVLPDWGSDFNRWGRLISGNSMEPEFEDGDIAIFEDRAVNVNNGVHATKDGEDAFKIIRHFEDGHGEFWPTNDVCRPFDAEGWEILGVCIQRVRYGEHRIRDTREYPYGFSHRFK